MATTDERDGGTADTAHVDTAHVDTAHVDTAHVDTAHVDTAPVDTAPVDPAEGDDIVVVPAEVDEPVGLSRRHALAGAAIVSVLVLIVAVALFTRHSRPTTGVRTTSPTTLAQAPVVAKAAPKPQPKSPPIAVATLPSTSAPTTAAAVLTPASVSAATTPPPAPTTTAPPQQYGASVLTWDAPHTLSVAAGRTTTLSVTAHNASDGTVNLPHPLSCAPRLDHSEMCPEMVQQITSGQSASAQYTIDARGIAKGAYTLSIEGVLTVRVTVS